MSRQEEIILVTASDSRYLSGVAALFASALVHLSPDYALRAVLLACDIDAERIEQFTRSLAPLVGPRFRLKILPVSGERFVGMATTRQELSVAAYGRLLIPEVFAGSKALYLDCDFIVGRDLSELWAIPFEDHLLMAVVEPGQTLDNNLRETFGLMDHDTYFNSGALVMDLDQIRASDADRICLDLASNSNHQFPQNDQCILNIVFARSTKYINACWNTQVVLEPDKPNVTPNEPVLIHTISAYKPWYYSRDNVRGIVKLFYQYMDMTLWENYRDDAVRFQHTCSAQRYAYTLFRMRLRHLANRLRTGLSIN